LNNDIPPAIGTEPGKKWTEASFRALLRGQIRAIYFRWPVRKLVLKRVREEVLVRKKDGKGYKKIIWYKCEKCSWLCKENLGKADKQALQEWKDEKKGLPKDSAPVRPATERRIWVDHIDPVVPLSGEPPDWHSYIMNTFVGPDKMQALCDSCHYTKSQQENAIRRENVKKREGAE